MSRKLDYRSQKAGGLILQRVAQPACAKLSPLKNKPQTKIWAKILLTITLCACLIISVGEDLTAQAKKKAAGPDPAAVAEAELKKNLDPLQAKLTRMMVKVESRQLLSPKEAGEVAELKYQLMDMMSQNPQNPLLAKPVYQAGVLMTQREEYNDAYELFSYVGNGFPTLTYGLKAKGQIRQLVKRFGADYFEVEAASAAATAPDPTVAPAASTAVTPGAVASATTPAAPVAAATPAAATPAPKK